MSGLLVEVDPQPADFSLRRGQDIHHDRLPDSAREFGVDRVVDQREDERFEAVLFVPSPPPVLRSVEERPPILAVLGGRTALYSSASAPVASATSRSIARRHCARLTELRNRRRTCRRARGVRSAIRMSEVALPEHARSALRLGEFLERLRGAAMLRAVHQCGVPDHAKMVVRDHSPPLRDLELRADDPADERIGQVRETRPLRPRRSASATERSGTRPTRRAGGPACRRPSSGHGFEDALERRQRVAPDVQVRPRTGGVDVHTPSGVERWSI